MMANKCSTSFVLLLLSCLLSFALAQTQCSASVPCKQGCCSKYGSCGFGSDFCSSANCVGNCDAVAECGQYAPSGKSKCPLNVCCSQYGFCGTTTDFCDPKCQNGCEKVSRPSCGGSSSSQRTIGYYESWSYNRKCDAWVPETIDPKMWTHLNYAFALIDSGNKISAMNTFDTQLYPRVTGLKKRNPALKVFISVGGWDAGGKVFSNMVSNSGSRSTFINSALAFMNTYGFDGIDIDWEYPVAPDREGADADFVNFVTFIKELKAACGSKYGVTLTLPSSYWYLKGFDIVGLQSYVDWFNVMSYDIHGTWDGNSPFTKVVVAPHTNLTEVSDGLDLLWRNKIDPKKVVLGMGFYGRSFTLKDSSCKTPGCPFSSGAKAGSCTATSGVLSNAEIQRIIKQKSLTPVLDKAAAIKYITWDNDQWVSYDDAETLQMKRTYANNLCLGGTMVWALDLDDPLTSQSVKNLNVEGLKLIGDDVDKNPLYAQQKLAAMNLQNNLDLMTIWSACMKEPECPKGYRKLTIGHGKVFDADLSRVTADGCHGGWGGYNRALCIEDSVTIVGSCKWYGKPGACKESCPKNQLLISTNSHVGSKSCNNGHFQSYCCDGEITARSISTCPSSNANNALGGGVARRDLSITVAGTKIECDAYAAQLLGTGAVLGMTIAGYFIYNRMPGNWAYQVGRGWFWVPLRNLVYNPQQAQPTCAYTTTVAIMTTIPTNQPHTTGCNFRDYPQACANYLSIVRNNRAGYETLWCPATAKQGSYRPAVAKWDRQHDTEWRRWVNHLAGVPRNSERDKCNRDEYPPFRFLAEKVQSYVQWVRFLPQDQNKGAGKYWGGVCTTKTSTNVQGGPVINNICTEYLSITTILNGFVLTVQNQPANMVDDLLTQNACLPTSLTDDPGFALFTDDVWYGGNINAQRSASAKANYPKSPLPALVNNRVAPRALPDKPAKRWLHEDYDGGDTADIIVDDGNSTRRATEQELLYYHKLKKCETDNCEDEQFGGFDVDVVGGNVKVKPAEPSVTEDGPVPTAMPTVTTDSLEASRPSLQSAEETAVDEDVGSERHNDLRKKHLRRHAHGHKHIG